MDTTSAKEIGYNTVLFSFLRELIAHRLKKEYLVQVGPSPSLDFDAIQGDSHLLEFIKCRKLNISEAVVLLLGLVPHLYPNFLTSIISEIFPEGGEFPEFGGVKGKNHRGIIPTGETVQFVLAGNNIQKRIELTKLFDEEHLFAKNRILYLGEIPKGEPKMSGRLIIDTEYVQLLTRGKMVNPGFSSEFPAREIITALNWEDLVLTDDVKEQIEELSSWIAHSDVLMNDWKMHKKLKPGYRALFYGASGTGKTLTATLLGKYTGKPVYRVDLSTVVSKYIGETEKNLERLFQKARNRDWILFFDEADAIFGKRTGVKDAHDRYANQEVSYLLQRVEDFEGLVILSSNFKSNIDEAFLRRFNAIIKFPFPNKYEREQIAHKSFPTHIKFENKVDIPSLISNYELSGGNIINVVQYACLKSIAKSSAEICKEDVLNGIKREVEKEGKVFRKLKGEIEPNYTSKNNN